MLYPRVEHQAVLAVVMVVVGPLVVRPDNARRDAVRLLRQSAVRPSDGLYRHSRSGPPARVAFTQVADFCQPAVVVILPLLAGSPLRCAGDRSDAS